MRDVSSNQVEAPPAPDARQGRADARRNLQALLDAAKAVFAEAGLDAPVRDIAGRAGVGTGTLYRHFPRRPDLIAAVFRREMDACADAATALASEHPPFEALELWMRRFTELVATKRGLAQALHSGDPAFDALPAHREQRLRPAFRALFDAAVVSGDIKSDIEADEFLSAAANLCHSVHDVRPEHAQRLVTLLVRGLRYDNDERPTSRT